MPRSCRDDRESKEVRPLMLAGIHGWRGVALVAVAAIWVVQNQVPGQIASLLLALVASLLPAPRPARPGTRALLGFALVAGAADVGLRVSFARDLVPLTLAAVFVDGLLFVVYLMLVVWAWWRSAPPPSQAGCSQATQGPAVAELASAGVVLIAVVAQLILGLAQARYRGLLWLHMGLGATVIMPLVAHLGIRTWLADGGDRRSRGLGLALVTVIVLQVALGMVAWAVPGSVDMGDYTGLADLVTARIHAWTGAVLLVLCTLFAARSFDPVPRQGTGER